MNYGSLYTASVADGLGLRTVLFVSGCHHHCKGCFNSQTWDPEYGRPYTKEVEDYLIRKTGMPYIDGITLLGGEPFFPCNIPVLISLCERIKAELPGKTIWCYTGATYEDLLPGGLEYSEEAWRLLTLVDVLVAGPFILKEKDVTIAFRGSRNQEIIDVQKSLETGEKEILNLD